MVGDTDNGGGGLCIFEEHGVYRKCLYVCFSVTLKILYFPFDTSLSRGLLRAVLFGDFWDVTGFII